MIFAFGFSNILTIILFLVILCIVIGWHELGHLLVAKKCNVYCYEYSLGFGPEIFRSKKHETHFVIRAIPLGGFVKMAGEEGQGVEGEEVIKDNNGNPIPKERLMGSTTKGRKVAIMAAGGIMNMILAVVCFYVYIAFSGGFAVPKTDSRISVIEYYENTTEETPLYAQGMESGDKITHLKTYLNDQTEFFENDTKTINEVVELLNKAKPTENGDVQYIIITYQDAKDKTINEVTVTRSANLVPVVDEEGNQKLDENNQPMTKLEISTIGLSQYIDIYRYNAFSALWGAWHFMGVNFVETFKALGRIFTGDLSNLSGLIGIYEVVDDVATSTGYSGGVRFINLIYLLGAISFSLGFFNLIPFPALDGGRIFFVGIEAITKKKINPNVEATIHFVGLILLFVLMIIINVRDVFNIFK